MEGEINIMTEQAREFFKKYYNGEYNVNTR